MDAIALSTNVYENSVRIISYHYQNPTANKKKSRKEREREKKETANGDPVLSLLNASDAKVLADVEELGMRDMDLLFSLPLLRFCV